MAGEDEIVVKFRADVSALEKQVGKATTVDKKNIDNATSSFKKLGQSSAKALQTKNVKEFGDAFKKVDKEVKATAASMGESAKKTQSLKSQLKDLKNEIAGLEKGSAKFNQLTKEAANLQDRIGDINSRVKALSSDTARFDAFAQGITGLAGGFAAAQAGAALFGEEDKELQKTMVKLQAAMTAVTGLQSLVNALNKDSAFSTIFLTKAQTAATSSTTLLGRSFGKLGLALLNNPITLIVVGLLAAIVAIKSFGKSTSQAEKDQLAFNEAVEAAQVAADDYTDKLNQVIDKIKDRYATEKRLLEAQGKDASGLTEKQFNQINKVINKELDKAVKARVIYAQRIEEIQTALSEKEAEIERENNALSLTGIKVFLLERLKLERNALVQSLSSNKAALSELGDLEREGLSTIKKNETEITIAKAEELKKRLDKSKEDYKKRLELERSFIKQLEDIRVKNIDDDDIRARATENLRFERQKQDIEKAAISAKLKNDLLAEIEIEHNNNIDKINEGYEKKRNDDLNDQIAATVEKFDEMDKQINSNVKINQEQLDETEDERERKKLEQYQKYLEAKSMLDDQYLQAFTSISNSLTLLGVENAELQKALAIFQIAIEQGKAVASAISGAVQAASFTGPAAPFIVGAYIAQAVAAALAGFAQAKSIVDGAPGFAKGVEYVNGRGTATSDSIPARLSKGERIVTADKNDKYWDELSAIHSGNYERFIQEKYVLPAIRQAVMNKNSSKFERAWKGDNLEFGLEINRKTAHKDALMIANAMKQLQHRSKRKY